MIFFEVITFQSDCDLQMKLAVGQSLPLLTYWGGKSRIYHSIIRRSSIRQTWNHLIFDTV